MQIYVKFSFDINLSTKPHEKITNLEDKTDDSLRV